ncbi:MAG: Hpt domain-containing protein [Nitrospinae bacterium CG11_big_fil_rev_8_21_14_0_20_56_8]|nr:MAG: Hpt domain-containing protein [Nitrospinae bacterium CG11_big_fil_rev_8_21_14_0_20_56_8]
MPFQSEGESLDGKFVVRIDPSLKELIPTYLKNRQTDLETLARALLDNDFSGIENVAHKMKGSGAGYGLHKITAIGQGLEHSARTKNAEQTKQYIQQLKRFMEQLEIVYG